MPLRVRRSSRQVQSSYSWKNWTNGVQDGQYHRDLVFTEQNVMTDMVTPMYHRKSRAGDVVINPMTKLSCSLTLHDPTCTVQTAGLKWEGKGQIFPSETGMLSLFDPADDLTLQSEMEFLGNGAITSAFADVGKPDVAVLTELVELRETLRFLWSPVRGMVNLTRRYDAFVKAWTRVDKQYQRKVHRWFARHQRWQSKGRKGTEPEKPKPPKYPTFRAGGISGDTLPSAWLAYRYGLMPLIYTFEDVQALLKKRAEGPKKRATARATRKTTVSYQKVWGRSSSTYGGYTYDQKRSAIGAFEVKCRAGVMYEPVYELSHQLGITMNQVPVALWEGIPFSFILDWFQNGIDVYQALTANFRAHKIHGAWKTFTCEGGLTFGVEFTDVSGIGSADISGPFGSVDVKWKRRLPASLADVRFQLKADLNGKRIADALSLVKLLLLASNKK